MSNIGLEKILKENNIKLTRTKVGDRYVVEKLVENDLNLGGEQSGHIVFLDYNNTGDGIVTALQILKIMEERQSSLGQLSKYMKKYPQVLINVKVKTKKDFSQIPDLKQAIKDTKRQLKDNGRLVLRYSGTEPLARIMIEGSSYQLIEKMAQTIAQIIKKNIGVD
jgi:phosphoglucosamine mutase